MLLLILSLAEVWRVHLRRALSHSGRRVLTLLASVGLHSNALIGPSSFGTRETQLPGSRTARCNQFDKPPDEPSRKIFAGATAFDAPASLVRASAFPPLRLLCVSVSPSPVISAPDLQDNGYYGALERRDLYSSFGNGTLPPALAEKVRICSYFGEFPNVLTVTPYAFFRKGIPCS